MEAFFELWPYILGGLGGLALAYPKIRPVVDFLKNLVPQKKDATLRGESFGSGGSDFEKNASLAVQLIVSAKERGSQGQVDDLISYLTKESAADLPVSLPSRKCETIKISEKK